MLGLLALAAGAGLLVATAVLVVTLVSPRGLTATLVGLAMAAFGVLVLSVQILSLLHAFGRVGLLVVHAVLFGLTALAWTRAGRPRALGGLDVRELVRATREGARRQPLVAALCIVAVGAMALQFLVGLVTAPTNFDSMAYHLSRAAYWLQESSALRFDGGTFRQLDSMPNAEMATAWTMALSGTDRYVELVQWFALASCVAGAAGLARMLGFTRAEAAAAGALFAVLPGPILQSVSTQNDLVVSACIVAAAFLGARGVREGHAGTIALAGVAFGLALGAKGTALFAIPAMLVIVGAAAWGARSSRRTLIGALAAALAGFALLGSFQYIQNLAVTGDPLGHQTDIVGRKRFGLAGNASRVLWNFVESPGVPLPVADRVFQQTVARVVLPTGDQVSVMRLGTEADHDRVAGGLIGWLVLLPLAFVLLVLPGTQLNRRAVAAGTLAYTVAIAASISATPYNGRLMIPALVLGAPLLALLARRQWALGAVAVLALLSLIPCLAISPMNTLLPERGQRFFFENDRVDQMSVTQPSQAPIIRAVEKRYGAKGPILFLGGENSWDYPYFGLRHERRVERIEQGQVPRDGQRPLCVWLRKAVQRTRVAAVLMIETPLEVPVPPTVTHALQPSPHNFVIDAGDIRRGCA